MMILASLFAEMLVNNRALIVRYEGKYFFPTYDHLITGATFGLDYEYETNYRQLAEEFKKESRGNYVLMPPVPFNAYENDLREDQFPPFPPSFKETVVMYF